MRVQGLVFGAGKSKYKKVSHVEYRSVKGSIAAVNWFFFRSKFYKSKSPAI